MLEFAYAKHLYDALGLKADFIAMCDNTKNQPTPPLPQGINTYSEAADQVVELCMANDPCQSPVPIFLCNERSVDESHPAAGFPAVSKNVCLLFITVLKMFVYYLLQF
jgi:hypothetical protein